MPINRLSSTQPANVADCLSMLMDRATLLAHRAAWSFKAAPHIAELTNLTADEASLYDAVRPDRPGRGARLKQERIPLRFVGSNA